MEAWAVMGVGMSLDVSYSSPSSSSNPSLQREAGVFPDVGTVPAGSGASVPLAATEQAGLLSHADLTSATKGFEGSRTTVAIP